MSGAWARACDAQEVSSDVNSDRHAGYAVQGLGQATVMLSTFGRMSRVEYAGAHIRAWRKSLRDQGERRWDMTNVPTERLLWVALHNVCRAQYWRTLDPSMAADYLRNAEAALRTWHKQQERP